MKSRLRKRKLAVQNVVSFFREVMFTRKINMECNSDRATLKRLYVKQMVEDLDPSVKKYMCTLQRRDSKSHWSYSLLDLITMLR